MIRLLELPDLKTRTGLQAPELQTPRGGDRPRTQFRHRERVRPGSPPAWDYEMRCRLLAGRAHIHVDFHADWYFNDFRRFPGHLALPLLPDAFRPWG